MFQLKGRYNIARVFLPTPENVDEETLKQIYTFLSHPAFAGEPICIMPDCHKGSGSCIGFTFKMNDYIVPNVVGVDIGCGMLSINLGQVEVDLPGLDNFVKGNIPMGFKIYEHREPCNSVEKWIEIFPKYFPSLIKDYPVESIARKMDKEKKVNDFYNSIGTLGGGNHFIELGKDEYENLWLTVHTGSRNFGLQVANYHQTQAKKLLKKMFVGADAYKDLEYLPIDNGGNEYLKDMQVAQLYAELNRKVIIYRIVKGFFHQEFNNLESIESVHNYINFDDKIIRKGAIQANAGQKVIIPFNMEDGLIIGEGLGNYEWNNSAPHGAGRLLSRHKAKEQLNLDEAIKSMKSKGIYTTSLNKDTLDEVKGAYKDRDLILNAIKDTVKVLHFVKPIYNVKAGGDK